MDSIAVGSHLEIASKIIVCYLFIRLECSLLREAAQSQGTCVLSLPIFSDSFGAPPLSIVNIPYIEMRYCVLPMLQWPGMLK
eukprot:c18854_g1_i1 orf=124-369(-)